MAVPGRGCVKTYFARLIGSLASKLELMICLRAVSAWLKLTGNKRPPEFSHSLDQNRPPELAHQISA
jgi:hypothetical protein